MLMSSKFRRRLFLIIANSINGLFIPLLNPIVSYLVIRLASVEVWGEFVAVLIVVQLGTHIVGWGNKDYLLREFSFNPARIAINWQTALLTRSLLLIAGAPLVLLAFPMQRALWVLVWSFAIVLDQAFDVLIQYRKDFAFSTLIELVGVGFLAAAILLIGVRIDLDRLIVLSGAVNLLKAGLYGLRYRRHILARIDRLSERIDRRYFSLAWPFFLLGLTGLLQSRIDLYAVSAFSSKADVGQYQVFMTFILYLQSIANFVLGPFVKNIYRLRYRSILSIAAKLFGLGVLIVLPGLVIVQVVLRDHYRIDLPIAFMIAGGLMAWPIYFYLPAIYALYKAGLQTVVVKINVLGIAVSFVFSLMLLPRLGLIGAVIGAAIAQWIMFAVYLLQSRVLREDHALVVPELS